MSHISAKILLVDDEPKNLIALSSILEGDGRELVSVRSGAEALRELLQDEFALILLDVHMPGLDGFETAELIRQRDNSRDTPILFITSAVRGEFAITRGYSLGAVDYLVRPVEPEILRYKVNVFVELYVKTAQVQRQANLLREAQEFLSSVLHGAVEHAIVALDPSGIIEVWNDGAHRMYGYSAREMLGRSYEAMFAIGDGAAGLLEAAGRSGSVDSEFGHRRRDGTLFPCRVVLSRRSTVANAASGFVLVVQDMTGAREAEEARAEIAALRQANSAKDEFLGLVSHELRTPLTTIVGNARALASRLDALPRETVCESLLEIDQNARRLQTMVESMLLLSRMEDGIGVELEPMLLQRLVPTVVREFSEQFGAADIEVRMPADLPPVRAHREYVTQVLQNLLSNAVKYSPEGGPIVIQAAPAGELVKTAVLDRGVGIRADECDLVFEPFKRLNRTQFLAVGAGLGLAVCTRLMDAMDGGMSAAPREGGGSEFAFSLVAEVAARSNS